MKKNSSFLILIIIFIATFFVYNNHFNNAFQFDDMHTIVNNENIKSLQNIPAFFKDASTTSTLPSNQAYRPGLTILNAIDYALSGNKMEPFYFHRSIFIVFLLSGLLCYFIFKQLLNKYNLNLQQNKYLALFGTAWFLLLTANAETINYIIARSDSFSTMTVLLAFVIYLYFPAKRKHHLYYLPIIIGFFVKEPVVMFLPILWVYQLLFEKDKSLTSLFNYKAKTFLNLVKNSLPILAITLLLIYVSRILTPDTWDSGGRSTFYYIITQPAVTLHYIQNFILPINLVIDSDWKPVTTILDIKVLYGFIFLILYLFAAFRISKNEKWRMASFGMLWFLLALLPTSTMSLAEVLNDHRPYFSYIGLFIVFLNIFQNILDRFNIKRVVVLPLAIAYLVANGYGTYQRNKVWHTQESLWKDATLKAPNNYRAKMNYAATLLLKKEYKTAETLFAEVIKNIPDYAQAYIKLATLYNDKKDFSIVPALLDKAIAIDANIPEAYFQYAVYYALNKNLQKAEELANRGLAISPKHKYLIELTEEIQKQKIQHSAIETNTINKVTPEFLVDISQKNFNEGKFEECIKNCQKALELNPNYDLPYVNLCCAYKKLGNFNKAIESAEQGLKINPKSQLLLVNLQEAIYLKNNTK